MSNRSLLTVITSMAAVCVLIIWTLLSQGNAPHVPAEKDKGAEPSADVSIDFPDESRGAYADAAAVNSRGSEYTYRIFNQTAGYNNYSAYLSAHGCSTCALTSILRNVDGLGDLTPDGCIDIQREVAGEAVFDRNFSKAARKQMPITQYGARKVFDAYGVEYQLPSDDPQQREAEITEWLQAGDPVYFTFGNGKEGHLSGGTHTVLLIGIDEDGYVIIGDSLHKSAAYWGSQGLFKSGKLTVADMLSYIKNDGPWSVCEDNTDESHFFYRGSSDRGYLLVHIDDKTEEDEKVVLAQTRSAD